MAKRSERSLILFPVFNTGTPAVKALENIDTIPMRDKIYFYSPLVNTIEDVRSYLYDNYSVVLIEIRRGWRYYFRLLRTRKLFRLCQEKARKAVFMGLDVLDSDLRNIVIILPVQKTIGLTIVQLANHKHILDFFFQLIPHREEITVCYRSQKLPSSIARRRIEELTRYHLNFVATEIQWNEERVTDRFELKEKSLIVLFEPPVSLRVARHLRRQFYLHPFVAIPLAARP